MEAHDLNLISGPQSLPTIDSDPCERADAARNRRRILAAAAALIDEHGVEHVSMDAIATQAGVGKGTLFRRFGDRSGLVMALLDEHERKLQDDLLRGTPPLGPGAPAADRLIAFLDAVVDLTERYSELLYDSETARAGSRFASGAYPAWHQHATLLIAEARPDADAPVLAHLLLAPLGAELFVHLRREERISVRRLRATLHALAGRATSQTSTPGSPA
jgi:AcrR family transcriptional regulator